MKKITVLVPVYKGSHVVGDALKSLQRQTYKHFDIIVGDDNKPEDKEESRRTKEVVDSFNKSGLNIRYIKNKKNLGCHKNFENLISQAKTPLVLFLAQDDIFSKNAVQIVLDAFEQYPEAAFLTRPYFWFEHDVHKPIRHIPPLNPQKHTLLSWQDGEVAVKGVFSSVGQISGQAIKKDLLREPYHTDIFPGHIYPIADLLKDYPGIFIKDYIVAVGTVDSQSRHITSIYDESPTEEWMRMFNTVYKEKKFDDFLKLCIEFMAKNFEGLVQIKNFGKPGKAQREIFVLLKYRWQNILEPRFWMYSILTLLVPRNILISTTDLYKRNILSKKIPEIPFQQ